MVQGFEQRTCHRFEIPNGKLFYRGKRLFGWEKEYTPAHNLLNVSKGGASFECNESFKPDQRLIIKLVVPDDTHIEVFANVRWQRETSGFLKAVGVVFAPFGRGFNLNPPAALDVLRRWDAKYVKVR